jgi:hypothetical protein
MDAPSNLPARRDSDDETLRKLKRYLVLRSEHKLFYEACRLVDLKPETVRHWREKNPQFADAEKLAAREGIEQAEVVLRDKAMEGKDTQALLKYLEVHTDEYKPAAQRTEHVLTVTLDAGNMIDRIRDLRHELERRQRDIPTAVVQENDWFTKPGTVDPDDLVVDAEVVE